MYAKFPRLTGNLGRETMMTSDFRPEVEIWRFVLPAAATLTRASPESGTSHT